MDFGRSSPGRSVVDLLSPLPLDTCLRLLGEQIDSSWRLSSSRPLTGSLRGTTMRATKRISYRNSFQTQLTAQLSAQGSGTRVDCRFAMNPFVVVFLAVWFTFVVAFGGTTMVAVLTSFATDPHGTPREALAGIFVPLAMMVGGTAMVAIGRYVARNERDEMLALVAATLQAETRQAEPRA